MPEVLSHFHQDPCIPIATIYSSLSVMSNFTLYPGNGDTCDIHESW
jgi:hypothetical protein